MISGRPRPYRLGKQEGGSQASDSGLSKLGRLSKGRRQKIAELTGCPHADAASLVDHLSRPAVARDLLGSLSPGALMAARVFLEAGDLLPLGVARAELEARLGQGAEVALAELDRAGVLLESEWPGGAKLIGTLPPLARSMRPFLWLLGDAKATDDIEVTEPASRASVGLARIRDLVLTLAAVASDPPRVARGSTVHNYDLSKLHREKLISAIPEEADLEGVCNRLFALGLLAGDAEDRVQVRWKRAEAFFDLPAASRLPLLVSTEPESAGANKAPGTTSPTRLRRLLCGGLADLPGGSWARRSALEDAVRMRVLASDNQSPYADLSRATARSKTQVRAVTRALLPCLDVYREGEETWMRQPAEEEADERAAWFVQPDHEIVAPPEIAPADLMRLATVADLVRADVVAQLRVCPESVARAAAAGLDPESVLERLEARAGRGLPEGLEVQIRDWMRQAAGGGRPRTADEEAESFWCSRPRQEGQARQQASAAAPHRRPAPPKLPRLPREGWSDPVSDFRDEAFERLASAGLVPSDGGK